MSNFDGTIDNRWRPDLASSQRRVREEEAERVSLSRTVSFVPARRKAFEVHDRQTAALIRRMEELARLPHGERVGELLEEWQWLDKMQGPDAKQRFLEPLIRRSQHDPGAHEDLVVFLMLVFEPVRRGVSKTFISVRSGVAPAPKDVTWANRQEAQVIHRIERESLYDVTREAALEALFRYPSKSPDRFFLWLRETIAHRALDKLIAELPEAECYAPNAAAAEALQNALAGFDQVEEPDMRGRAGLRQWRMRIHMRDVFASVEQFFDHNPVREACQEAVGRLPRRQFDAVDGYFFRGASVEALAEARGVSPSTIYNQKIQGQKKLRGDETFFSTLLSLGAITEEARRQHLAEKYPDGRLPDGRRVVHIEAA